MVVLSMIELNFSLRGICPYVPPIFVSFCFRPESEKQPVLLERVFLWLYNKKLTMFLGENDSILQLLNGFR